MRWDMSDRARPSFFDGRRGAFLQSTLAGATCSAVVLGIFLAGWDQVRMGEPAWAPPAWFGSAVWVCLFVALGFARWRLSRIANERPRQDGPTGRRTLAASSRLDLLMANILLYPLYTEGFSEPLLGLGGNVLTIGLSIWAAAAAWKSSRTAAILIALPVLWVEFATLLVLIELGWV